MSCKLCGNDNKLLKSHIIPEHVFSDVYDKKHRFKGIEADGNSKFEQKGLREELLCRNCEQLLSRKYEHYFAKFWYQKRKVPNVVNSDYVDINRIDYLKFKLYHLSILYRASVSSLPTFSNVSLGPHEAKIRDMLLNAEDNTNYHIFGVLILDEKGRPMTKLIIPPQRKYYGGHTAYETIFGGCAWYVKISSHRSKDIEQISLKKYGTMSLVTERYESFKSIQDVSEVLKAKNSST